MRVKFYGHQTWEVLVDAGTVLFDPLLQPYFGASEDSFCAIYPFRIAPQPRRLTAIFLSHEHADHFCVESLSNIDRSTPIYTGYLMPHSVDWCLKKLGFTVSKFHSGERIELACGLVVTAFHCSEDTPFWERRVYQFVVGDGESNFYLAVDGGVSGETLDKMRSKGIVDPGLFAVSNNSQMTWLHRRSAMQNDRVDVSYDRQKNGLAALNVYTQLMYECLPEVDNVHIAVCGGGVMKGFEDLHPHPISEHWDITPHIAKFSSDKITAPRPGTIYVMAENKVMSVEEDPLFESLSSEEFKDKFMGDEVEIKCGYYSLTHHKIFDYDTLSARAFDVLDDFWLADEGEKFYWYCIENSLPCTISFSLDRESGEPAFTLIKDMASGARGCSKEIGTLSIRMHESDFYALTEGHLDIWELSGSHISTGFPTGSRNLVITFLYSYFGEQVNQRLAFQFVNRKMRMLSDAH